MKVSREKGQRGKQGAGESSWHLRLYIAGGTSRSLAALRNLQKICDEHLPGKYQTEVVDLLKNPQLAAGDQILAVPTLVRTLPQPLRKIIGDLSDTQRVPRIPALGQSTLERLINELLRMRVGGTPAFTGIETWFEHMWPLRHKSRASPAQVFEAEAA